LRDLFCRWKTFLPPLFASLVDRQILGFTLNAFAASVKQNDVLTGFFVAARRCAMPGPTTDAIFDEASCAVWNRQPYRRPVEQMEYFVL
jgi:hypothetical protein